MIAPTPGRLIETSDIILNLNPPCAIADPSWIKPGKAAWDWWTESFAKNVPFKPGMNTATMKHYIDFAGSHGLEYMLIDGGWYADEHLQVHSRESTCPRSWPGPRAGTSGSCCGSTGSR